MNCVLLHDDITQLYKQIKLEKNVQLIKSLVNVTTGIVLNGTK